MQDDVWGQRKSLLGLGASQKHQTLQVIYSLIDDHRKIAAGHWALSLVKSKDKEHAFILLEGKINDEFVIFKTDLFLRKDTDKALFGQPLQRGNVLDKLLEGSASSRGRAFVKVSQLLIKDYDDIILNREFQGWSIDTDQAEKLLKRLQTEGLKEYNYHSGGDSSILSASDSRSSRTNCIKWCEQILKEVLGKHLVGDAWRTVVMPSSRVQLIKQFAEKNRQQQLVSPVSATSASPLEPRAQHQESRARMSPIDPAKYCQPVDNRTASRSLVDPTFVVISRLCLVSIAQGKIPQTKHRKFFVVESVEQQYYIFRRIDLGNSLPMDVISKDFNPSNHLLMDIQSMRDEYTIDSVNVPFEKLAKLLAIIGDENQRRLSTSPTNTRTGIGLFNGRSSTKAFVASLVEYLQSINVNILPEGPTI